MHRMIKLIDRVASLRGRKNNPTTSLVASREYCDCKKLNGAWSHSPRGSIIKTQAYIKFDDDGLKIAAWLDVLSNGATPNCVGNDQRNRNCAILGRC